MKVSGLYLLSAIYLLLNPLSVMATDQVDSDTFIGWKLYHDSCVTCHGVGGVGTPLAPDLTESLQRLSPTEFRLKILNRYLVEVPREDAMSETRTIVRDTFLKEMNKSEMLDEAGMPMPEWKHNPIVSEHVDYLYRYLKARSMGTIGSERPEIIKE